MQTITIAILIALGLACGASYYRSTELKLYLALLAGQAIVWSGVAVAWWVQGKGWL